MRCAYKRWVRVVKVVVREGWGQAGWWLRLKFGRLLALWGVSLINWRHACVAVFARARDACHVPARLLNADQQPGAVT